MPIIHFVNKYRKIPRTSPEPIFVQKAFLVGLVSGVEEGGLILEGFCASKWFGLYLEGILHLKMDLGWRN